MDAADHIGDRIEHPERVPPEYQHLIADDLQRVMRLVEFEAHGKVLDVGCSDGAVAKRIAQRWPVQMVQCDVTGHIPGNGLPYFTWDCREPADLAHSGPFDRIYCTEVLEHLTQADAS
jgi:2-polyprenyl-3-methyl-5-hydroxy-6-metoxy-1,4-benzoquinol methylase